MAMFVCMVYVYYGNVRMCGIGVAWQCSYVWYRYSMAIFTCRYRDTMAMFICVV